MTSGVGQLREVEHRFINNNRELLIQYAGQWVALEGESIIAADTDEFVVDRRAREAGIDIPFLFFVRPPGAPTIIIGPIFA